MQCLSLFHQNGHVAIDIIPRSGPVDRLQGFAMRTQTISHDRDELCMDLLLVFLVVLVEAVSESPYRRRPGFVLVSTYQIPRA